MDTRGEAADFLAPLLRALAGSLDATVTWQGFGGNGRHFGWGDAMIGYRFLVQFPRRPTGFGAFARGAARRHGISVLTEDEIQHIAPDPTDPPLGAPPHRPMTSTAP